MSLNFRPTHDKSGRFSDFRFYSHHLLVLFGFQPSISSLLRSYLFPALSFKTSQLDSSALDAIRRDLPGVATTAAYLIFSDGDETLTIEKDHHTGLVRSSNEFIVATNHDVSEEDTTQPLKATHEKSFKTLLDGMVVGSIGRRNVATKLWERSTKRAKRNPTTKANAQRQNVTKDTVIRWMDTDPILNEETHFATIMDPKDGKVVWTKRYMEPFE